MLENRWVIIMMLGLAIASSGQAQEEIRPEQQQSQDRGSLQSLPIPLPVQIIEDAEALSAARVREDEDRQREVADLIAQQGMNVATQAMNVATEKMVYYSKLSTILVGIGTLLLFWTLVLTRQANRAAQEAVSVTGDIGERQVRAYVHIKESDLEWDEAIERYKISITFKNYGQSPARCVKLFGMKYHGPEVVIDTAVALGPPTVFPDIGPQAYLTWSFPVKDLDLGGADSNEVKSQIRVIGQLTYKDVFDKNRETSFTFRTTPGKDLSKARLHLGEDGNCAT